MSYFRNCQTSTATPAQPFQLPTTHGLRGVFDKGDRIAVTGYYAGVDPDFAAPRLVIVLQKAERQ